MNKQQKLVLYISILASNVAFLDGSVVNVALPAIMRELGGGLTIQQWVVDSYLITLGALILIAGSLSDTFGRKQVLRIGLIGFALASVLCAVAPNGPFLVIMRAVQGVAGALLVPSSLALIISSFDSSSQGKAIGRWTAWTGIAFIVGPLIGGFLVDAYSWRLIFAINIVPVALTLWLMRLLPPEQITAKNAKTDVIGAVLCAVGLGSSVFALIEQAHFGWSTPIIYIPAIIGVLSLSYFLWFEHTTSHPMLPLELFKIRNFGVGNAATAVIYAGLSVAIFLITVFIQQIGHYSAIEAGLALLPVTIIMFFLSPRFGALATKYGPRIFMTVGPLLAGLGFLAMIRIGQNVHYFTELLPAILLFGLGLSITVAPLTSAILGSIDPHRAGIGSAINNAISRIAGLLAVAALSIVAGTSLSVSGFHKGVFLMAILLFIGAIISGIGIQNPVTDKKSKVAATT